MEMLQNEQNENFMPPELVNQGSIKRYTDLPSTTPANLNFRKPQRISSNFNSFNNQNIQMNSNILKSQENQSQKKEIIPTEDKPVIPEKTISDFYQNDFLADAILKVDNFFINILVQINQMKKIKEEFKLFYYLK